MPPGFASSTAGGLSARAYWLALVCGVVLCSAINQGVDYLYRDPSAYSQSMTTRFAHNRAEAHSRAVEKTRRLEANADR
jgi:hypothetical protein